MISPSSQHDFSPLTTYALLLGDFQQSTYFSSPVLTCIFVWYSFTMTIMLLNIAIGLIGDTLERVQAQKETLVLQIRAELILNFQKTMGADQMQDPGLFPQAGCNACNHRTQRLQHSCRA